MQFISAVTLMQRVLPRILVAVLGMCMSLCCVCIYVVYIHKCIMQVLGDMQFLLYR